MYSKLISEKGSTLKGLSSYDYHPSFLVSFMCHRKGISLLLGGAGLQIEFKGYEQKLMECLGL